MTDPAAKTENEKLIAEAKHLNGPAHLVDLACRLAEALEDAEREKTALMEPSLGAMTDLLCNMAEADIDPEALEKAIKRAEAAEADGKRLRKAAFKLVQSITHGATWSDAITELNRAALGSPLMPAETPAEPDKASGEAGQSKGLAHDRVFGIWTCRDCQETAGSPSEIKHAPDCPFAQQGKKHPVDAAWEKYVEPMISEPDPEAVFRKIIAAESKSKAGLAPFLHALSTAEQRGRAKALVQSEPDPDGGERYSIREIWPAGHIWVAVEFIDEDPKLMVRKCDAQRIATALEEMDRLRAALEGYIDALPAFRLKPIGSPHSLARMKQDKHIALEDQARTALASKEPGDV